MQDVKIEWLRGQGPGGQRKNKVLTACRLTHTITGIQAYADKRTRTHSLKSATKDLEQKIEAAKQEKVAAKKKARRDIAIHERDIIRTYDFTSDTVKDHRTKKRASIKQVIEKGRFDLICPKP